MEQARFHEFFIEKKSYVNLIFLSAIESWKYILTLLVLDISRNWDQFEINKTLFGVESTFDEELYTTKLERGPQMRERERDAWRIAREIEGQSTKNLHLAEVKFLQDCVPHRALNSFSLWHKIYLEVLTG